MCVCVCFLSSDAWHETKCWSHPSIYINLLTEICWWARDARTEHNRTLALLTEICLTRKYLMKCSLGRGKITFRFTLSTACGCATLPFQPNRFLRVSVMLTYLQSSQHGCCWCLRPGRINVMSNNSGQQSPGCYREVVLFTSSGWTEPNRTRTKWPGSKSGNSPAFVGSETELLEPTWGRLAKS